MAETTLAMRRGWGEVTYGSRWMNAPSPQCYQIWRMECVDCEFFVEPSNFRRYDESRTEHPQAYGNFASIAHARKIMREHRKGHGRRDG